jgi:hypothetical protein
MKTKVWFLLGLLLLGVAMIFVLLVRKTPQTQSETCGENPTWSLDEHNGTLTIRGTGAMTDDSHTSILSILKYSYSPIEKVIIEDGVTSIGEGTFSHYCNYLTDIIVENGNVSYSAENGVLFNKDKTTLICYPAGKAESSYIIPNSVTSIGNGAFSDCGLTVITIPNSVTSIGNWAFSGCSSLTDIIVENGNISYSAENGVLFNKDKTTLICYPAGKAESSYTIPNSVTNIGVGALSGCQGLTTITIPNSVTSIGNRVFIDCTNLTDIIVENENISYSAENGVLFNKDKTTLICYPAGKGESSYTIPNSVTSIGVGAFSDCHSLTTIIIPNSVTSIGERAFLHCDNLTTIAIPNSVISIGEWAFFRCESLTTITIPNSVTSIGNSAFSYCNLTTIAIPNSVTSIGEGAFFNCESLTTITIPNSVTSIGNYAFYCCSCLPAITIPNSVISIGDKAFAHCLNLTTVTIPSSVTSIGDEVFYNCRNLATVTIPNSVTSIGNGAFSNCDNLTDIIVENGNVFYSAENGVLFNKDKTTLIHYPAGKAEGSYIIPNSVKSIGDKSFSYCDSLTTVAIPNSVTSIGNSAFFCCRSLTAVTIPNSVTSIGNSAFSHWNELTAVTIPNSVKSIGNWPFSGCLRLTDIIVEKGNVSYSAENGVLFNKDKTALICYPAGKAESSYIIPNSVTSIEGYAFSSCTNLTAVTIPNSVISIGDYAFSSCNLTSVANLNPTPQNIYCDVFNDSYGYMNLSITLYVPPKSVEAYKAANVWKDFDTITRIKR